jgi:hypothetical protein
MNFAASPLPAGLFGPGSQAYTLPTALEGNPSKLAVQPPGALASSDVVVERPDDFNISPVSSVTTRIIVRAFALKAIVPLLINFGPPAPPHSELWDFNICVYRTFGR